MRAGGGDFFHKERSSNVRGFAPSDGSDTASVVAAITEQSGAAAVKCYSIQTTDRAVHNASVADAERAARDVRAAVAERTTGEASAAGAERSARASACLVTPEASASAVERTATNACTAHLWGGDAADQSVFKVVPTVQTPSMLLQRPTQLRSIWSWLLSELRRPSCNALVLQPRTGQVQQPHTGQTHFCQLPMYGLLSWRSRWRSCASHLLRAPSGSVALMLRVQAVMRHRGVVSRAVVSSQSSSYFLPS